METHKLIYNCPTCTRSYKRKIFYDRHIAACALLNQSKSEREDDIERCADTPTVRELYEMMMTLAKRNEFLEKKVDELSKWVAIRKKRLHVTEWLDHNYQDAPIFENYTSNIKITKTDLETVWKYDYIEGISHIIKQWFPLENENLLPIRAFDQKDNTFFIKTNTGWIVMPTNILEKEISRIGKQLMGLFVKWQEENSHRMEREDYAIEYTTKIQKVIGGNFSHEQSCVKIRRNIYKYLKTNLKDIIQFEFTV